MGCSIELHKFDPANQLYDWEFSQLVSGSEDGFPLIEEQQGYWNGPDPPFSDSLDYDSPYQEQES